MMKFKLSPNNEFWGMLNNLFLNINKIDKRCETRVELNEVGLTLSIFLFRS